MSTTETTSEYTYFAFVSYSHKDEKWAKWIQSSLEGYRLPSAVRKAGGKNLPRRIHPVFRDVTDLGAGKLADNLRKELEQSRFLIVVCSPNSARPNAEGKHWIDDEVRRFRELGRTDRIVPVVVEGTPATSFCPTLAEEGLLALDATKHSRARILNDLVAKILGLRPDELWRREERRIRARRVRRTAGALAAAAVLALGVGAVWDCTRTVRRDFAACETSYGLPEGVGPLSPEEAASRHEHYRFEFRGYRCGWFTPFLHADSAEPSLLRALGFRRILRRVVHADSHGKTIAQGDFLTAHLPPVQSFEYDANGCLSATAGFGTDGSPRFVARWSFPPLVPQAAPSSAIVSFADSDGNLVRPPPPLFGELGRSADEIAEADKNLWRIAEWKLAFDGEGRGASLTFQNAFHRPVADRAGVVSIEIDRDGTQTVWKFRSDTGEGLVPRGETGQTYVYNGKISPFKGIYSGRRFEDPTRDSWEMDKEGIYGIRREEPSPGVARTTFLDRNGAPKWHIGRWWTTREQTFDNGNPVAVRFDSPDDIRGGIMSPRLEDTGEAAYAYAPPRYVRMAIGHDSEFDGQGNEVSRVFVDAAGKPVATEDGFAGYRTEFDGRGNAVKRIFLGEDLQPVSLENGGHSGWRKEFDDEGRVVSFLYTDGEGKPFVNRREFFARCDTEYDAAGHVVRKTFFDDTGAPFLMPDGYAGWESEYDAAGNETKTVWLDTEGRPLLQPEGYAAVERRFDERGNRIHTAYLGEDLRPLMQPEGFAMSSKAWDAAGHAVSLRYFDAEGRPVARNEGYAGWDKAFDPNGCETNRMYVDAEGRPVLVDDRDCGRKVGPVAGWWKRFGAKGEEVEIGTWGVDGRPMVNRLGWAVCRTEDGGELWLDAEGNPVKRTGIGEKTSFDSARVKTTWYFERGTGRQVPGPDGAFGVREFLDETGETTNTVFLALDESPMATRNGHASVAREFGVFGGQRKPVKTSWFDENGCPVVSGEYKCAVLVETWDDWGLDTAWIEYDENGALIEQYPEEGAAYRLFEMLHRPQTYTETKMTWIGTNGLPVVGKKSGYATRTHDYSDDRQTVTTRYFDAEGHPIGLSGGQCGTIISKDAHRHETNVVYLGAGDVPVVHSVKGYAMYSRTYDYSRGGDGLLTGESYFGPDGRPMATPGGEAGWRAVFDLAGNQTERTFFGVDGEPVMTTNGYAIRRRTYDCSHGTNALVASESYFGPDGLPVARANGEAGWRDLFDAAGRQTERTYFGVDGEPVMTKYGFATRRMFYDADGVETNRVRFDAAGKPLPSKKSTKKKGPMSWKPHYDESGLLVSETYEDASGELGRDPWSKTSSIVYRYDEKSRETNRVYLGTAGEPVCCKDWKFDKNATPGRDWKEWGYHELRQSHDEAGNVAEKSFWNTDGSPMVCNFGVHVVRYVRDGEGRILETRYFGTDGQPCGNREGIHAERRVLAEDGTWTDTIRFAPDGKTRLWGWSTAVVKSVEPGSPAARLGIKPGDRWFLAPGKNVFLDIYFESAFRHHPIYEACDQWCQRLAGAGIDTNWVFVCARKENDAFSVVAFAARKGGFPVIFERELGVESAPNPSCPSLEEGEAFVDAVREWLETAGPESVETFELEAAGK